MRPVGPACRGEPLRPPLALAVDPGGCFSSFPFRWFVLVLDVAQTVELRLGDHLAPSGGLFNGEGGPALPGEPRRGAPCPVSLR